MRRVSRIRSVAQVSQPLAAGADLAEAKKAFVLNVFARLRAANLILRLPNPQDRQLGALVAPGVAELAANQGSVPAGSLDTWGDALLALTTDPRGDGTFQLDLQSLQASGLLSRPGWKAGVVSLDEINQALFGTPMPSDGFPDAVSSPTVSTPTRDRSPAGCRFSWALQR